MGEQAKGATDPRCPVCEKPVAECPCELTDFWKWAWAMRARVLTAEQNNHQLGTELQKATGIVSAMGAKLDAVLAENMRLRIGAGLN